jgi:phage shock protein B
MYQEIFFVSIILFLVIVAPTWIVFHYRAKANMVNGLNANERADVEEMMQVANKMAARIETLESILDVESPDWREKQSP